MSFTQNTFATVGAQASPAPTVYSYSSTDNLAAVTASGYFNEKQNQLNEGDFIISFLIDGHALLEVLADTSTVQPSSVSASALSAVTAIGNNTSDDIILTDGADVELHTVLGERIGNFGASSSGFGTNVSGISEVGQPLPLTVAGSSLNILASQIGFNFSGINEGEFLRFGKQFTIEGLPVFISQSTPLDVDEFTESFTDATDIVLTGSFQTIATGVATFDYQVGTTRISFDFTVEEAAKIDTEVEYRVSIANGVPTGPANAFIIGYLGLHKVHHLIAAALCLAASQWSHDHYTGGVVFYISLENFTISLEINNQRCLTQASSPSFLPIASVSLPPDKSISLGLVAISPDISIALSLGCVYCAILSHASTANFKPANRACAKRVS